MLESTVRPKVFVTREIPSVGLDRLRSECEVDVWDGPLPPPDDELRRRAAGCAGVLTLLSDRVDAALMDAAGPSLKVVANYAVGFNNIDAAEAAKRGIAVGNTPGVLTDATADLAVALLLAAARCVVSSEKSIHAGQWKTWEPLGHLGFELAGKTVGIVGMGRIGMATAKRLHGGWGMRVLYFGRSDCHEAETTLGARRVSFEEMLEQSDFVSAHCALTDETRYLFDATAFARMKSTAIFINTARGQVHRQADLIAALREGTIRAAGLDVLDPEPPAPDDPIMKLPNCVVTPHIGSATHAAREAMAHIAAENILAGLAGRPLPHPVPVGG